MDSQELKDYIIYRFENIENGNSWFVEPDTIEVKNSYISLEVRYIMNRFSGIYLVKEFMWSMVNAMDYMKKSEDEIFDYIVSSIETYAKSWNTSSFRNIFAGR